MWERPPPSGLMTASRRLPGGSPLHFWANSSLRALTDDTRGIMIKKDKEKGEAAAALRRRGGQH